ncbi:MAG: hypothetical protein ACREHE_13975 [Rhizomicrobium sp.]
MLRDTDIHSTARAQTPAGLRGEEAGVVSMCCCCCHLKQAGAGGSGNGPNDARGEEPVRFYDRDHATDAAKMFYAKARERFIAPAQSLVTGARRALGVAALAVCAAAAATGALALAPGIALRFGLLPFAPAAALGAFTGLYWFVLAVRRYDTMREARHQKRWIYQHELVAKSQNAVEQFRTFDPDDTTSALWGLGQMALIARVHEHLDHNLHIENIMTGVRWQNTRRATVQLAVIAALGALAVIALRLRAELRLDPESIAACAALAATGTVFAASLLLGNAFVSRIRTFLEPPRDATAYSTDPFTDIARWHHHLLALLSRAQSFFRRWN